MGVEQDDEKAANAIAELKVISGAYRETKQAPMCCFRCDSQRRLICDAEGPLIHELFMKNCLRCQSEMKDVLDLLKIN